MPFRFTFLLAACFGLALPAAARDRPNVVLILVDDMGAHDLSIEGSTFYETPHIDRLARGGMRFTQGYATCRVCSPSRASIQLGQFTARHGITDWIGARTGMDWNRDDRLLPAEYLRQLPHADVTLAEAMQAGGYRTFFAGKWHLGGEGSLPAEHGFDVNRGGHERGSPPGGYFSPYKNPRLEDGAPGESLPLRLADETAQFIKAADDRPYFAMLSFYSVHSPVQTTRQLWSKYQQKAAALPDPGGRFKIDRTMPVRQVQDHPVYAGMVEVTDQAVGRVLAAVDEAGCAESTIVIFTSDNGGVSSGDAYATSNLPLRGGKGRQWEGGIREPFYIRYPPIAAPNSTSDVPVTGADLYPTILQLCGLPLRPEQHIDGVSLVPLLEGDAIADRPLYWHYPHYGNQGGEPGSMVRIGPWKLIHYYEDGRNELYHLHRDPSESINVALSYPVRSATMWKQLDQWLISVDAQRPTPDPRYSPASSEAKHERLHTQKKAQLEAQHAAMLEPDWQPDATWYGSEEPLRASKRAPEMQWHKGYGTDNGDHPHFVMETSDGGFIMTGEAVSNEDSDILVVKTDAQGDKQWQRRLGGDGEDLGNYICETDSGDFIVAGAIDKNRALVKLGPTGKTIWEQTFLGAGRDAIEGIDLTRDGGLIATGYLHGEEGATFVVHEGRAFLLKTDGQGTLQWETSLFPVSTQGMKVREVPTGYAIAATTPRGSGNFCVIKTDNRGSIQWHRDYGGDAQEDLYDFDATSDGGYVLAGHKLIHGHVSDNTDVFDFWLVKVDRNGEPQWDKTFGQPRGYNSRYIRDECYGVRQTPDGGYIMCGGNGDETSSFSESGSPYGPSDVWQVYLVKTDADGALEWESCYGSTKKHDAGEYIGLTRDGGYIIAVDADEAGSETYRPNNFGFMKIAPDQSATPR